MSRTYFAVEKLNQTPEGKATYARYIAKNSEGKPEATPFPIITGLFPDQVPAVAGIDNAKRKVFDDYKGYLAKVEQAKSKWQGAPEWSAHHS